MLPPPSSLPLKTPATARMMKRRITPPAPIAAIIRVWLGERPVAAGRACRARRRRGNGALLGAEVSTAALRLRPRGSGIEGSVAPGAIASSFVEIVVASSRASSSCCR